MGVALEVALEVGGYVRDGRVTLEVVGLRQRCVVCGGGYVRGSRVLLEVADCIGV